MIYDSEFLWIEISRLYITGKCRHGNNSRNFFFWNSSFYQGLLLDVIYTYNFVHKSAAKPFFKTQQFEKNPGCSFEFCRISFRDRIMYIQYQLAAKQPRD